MNADGTRQRRLTFGGGWYAAPEWSPDGKLIAFTRRSSDGRHIGIIGSDGSNEKLLTNARNDEGPSWAPSSRELLFQRVDGSGRPALFRVGLDGSAARQVTTPQSGSDPDWSGAVD